MANSNHRRALRCPKCRSTAIEVTARLHYHHTYFGRPSPGLHFAKSSEVRCSDCRYHWRTESFGADGLLDALRNDRCCEGFEPNDLRLALDRVRPPCATCEHNASAHDDEVGDCWCPDANREAGIPLDECPMHGHDYHPKVGVRPPEARGFS